MCVVYEKLIEWNEKLTTSDMCLMLTDVVLWYIFFPLFSQRSMFNCYYPFALLQKNAACCLCFSYFFVLTPDIWAIRNRGNLPPPTQSTQHAQPNLFKLLLFFSISMCMILTLAIDAYVNHTTHLCWIQNQILSQLKKWITCEPYETTIANTFLELFTSFPRHKTVAIFWLWLYFLRIQNYEHV